MEGFNITELYLLGIDEIFSPLDYKYNTRAIRNKTKIYLQQKTTQKL